MLDVMRNKHKLEYQHHICSFLIVDVVNTDKGSAS